MSDSHDVNFYIRKLLAEDKKRESALAAYQSRRRYERAIKMRRKFYLVVDRPSGIDWKRY